MTEQQKQTRWCDPGHVAKEVPPRINSQFDSTYALADQLKYVYAGISQMFAELEYTLADAAGTGRIDPKLNEQLQWEWCFPAWEFLYCNTTRAVRHPDTEEDDTQDEADNTYSDGTQVKVRYSSEEWRAQYSNWPHNEHICGDGAHQEYPTGTVSEIAGPPQRSPKAV